MAWMEQWDTSILANIRQGTILVPETDRILDREAMMNAARHSSTSVRIVETRGTSHFITLDSERWVPSMDDIPRVA